MAGPSIPPAGVSSGGRSQRSFRPRPVGAARRRGSGRREVASRRATGRNVAGARQGRPKVGVVASPFTLHDPDPNGYSHTATVPDGVTLVICSGQLPIGPNGESPQAGAWVQQAEWAFARLGRALAAGGATWNDVVRLGVYVTTFDGLQAVRDVRDRYVNTTQPPASTLVGVTGLVLPDAFIEVEATAAIAPAPR